MKHLLIMTGKTGAKLDTVILYIFGKGSFTTLR